MTTDESILEEMLERSTNPVKEDVDNNAVQFFCMIVNSNVDLITKAHELLVKKISSMDITEANRAVGVLEECMSKGGEEFQKRTAKFVFLNELIALVLGKHTAQPVPVETKKRIMECLLLWTIEHSSKKKIQEAYDNLKKQVNFDGPKALNTNSNPSTPLSLLSNGAKEQRSSILGKDDELVAKLLKQGGEENYKKANLLIQHRFNQEAKRTEFVCHLKSEIKKFEDTMELLDQMLNSDSPGEDEDLVMQELYNMCKGHHDQMARWPDFLVDTPEFLEDVLTTKDNLVVCMQRYKEKRRDGDVASQPILQSAATTAKVLQNSKVTLPTTKSAAATSTTNDILTELLGGVLNPSSSITNTKNQQKDHTTLDDLAEIFGSIETNTDQTKYPADLLGNIDLLEPISVFAGETKATTMEKTDTNSDEEMQKPKGFKELREIDKLSEEMFKQSLQTEQRQATFKKEPEKITLNDLVKDKIHTSLKASSKSNGKSKQSSLECKETKEEDLPVASSDDIEENEDKIDTTDDTLSLNVKAGNEDNMMTASTVIKSLPVKPLAEITIELDDLTPGLEDQRSLLDNEDIEVTLNFTADRPSAHVSVIVMTVTNKSRLPVKDFQFEASVKKPSKVRLLPATETSMAPRKPFRPSEPINQVILLMNPTEKAVDITCIVGYKLGDDPDQIKEPIVAKDIPYV